MAHLVMPKPCSRLSQNIPDKQQHLATLESSLRLTMRQNPLNMVFVEICQVGSERGGSYALPIQNSWPL
ncbi:hypothetical protein TNCV_909241 [Trichonephila clavipes]|nr:hypothetical protein TNCV_909241 [Trichonephila clavipes]